jgi:hypothetical protein
MKAIISIAALAMIFASVSAHELHGGLNVSPRSTFSIVYTIQTLPSFLSPTTYLSCSDSCQCWVTALPLTSSLAASALQVLSDVITTNAYHEISGKSHEWHRTTKFIADINPCDTYAVKFSDCLLSEGESVSDVVACFHCLQEAYNSFFYAGYMCADLKEIGYCDAIVNYAENVCNNLCSAELNDVVECIVTFDGCTDEHYYLSECLSEI